MKEVREKLFSPNGIKENKKKLRRNLLITSNFYSFFERMRSAWRHASSLGRAASRDSPSRRSRGA